MPASPIRYCRRCATRLARDNSSTACAPCQKKERDLAVASPEVPPDFWASEPVKSAITSWHIGQIIRAYRHHPFHGPRPLPQEVVAGWLGVTQTQLSRIESGPPVKDLDRLVAWAKILKIPADLLWFKLPDTRDGRPTPVRTPSPVAGLPVSAVSPPIPVGGGALSGTSDVAAMQAFRAADRQVGGGHLYATVCSYLHTAVAPRLFGGADAGETARSSPPPGP